MYPYNRCLGSTIIRKKFIVKKLYNFDSLSLQIKEGLGTLFAIEFRIKKNLDKATYVFQPYDGESTTFSTINEVMSYSNIYRDDPRIFECTIIITTKHNFDFRIVDLPGCVVGKEKYFEQIKEKYLMRKQTVIVHVRKATDNENSIILYSLDNDKTKQDKILELIPEIRKYYSFSIFYLVKHSCNLFEIVSSLSS